MKPVSIEDAGIVELKLHRGSETGCHLRKIAASGLEIRERLTQKRQHPPRLQIAAPKVCRLLFRVQLRDIQKDQRNQSATDSFKNT